MGSGPLPETKSQLEKEVHDEIKTFECPTCHIVLNEKELLNKHMEIAHPRKKQFMGPVGPFKYWLK